MNRFGVMSNSWRDLRWALTSMVSCVTTIVQKTGRLFNILWVITKTLENKIK